MSSCTTDSTLKVIQGEDFTFEIAFKDEDGAAYDLTGTTELTVCFIPISAPSVTVTLTGGEVTIATPTNGKAEVTISDTKTALMESGTAKGFEAEIEVGTDKRIVQFLSAIDVIERIC